MTGTVVGYDPGGNGKHGFARALVRGGDIVCVTTKTLQTAEDVVRSILDGEKPLGLGIDTLTCWSTGHSGWRPADRWLRQRYPGVKRAIVAPGGLFGAMSVNGMAVLVAVRQAFPDIFVTETHPKVLYHALFKDIFDFDGKGPTMTKQLNQLLAVKNIEDADPPDPPVGRVFDVPDIARRPAPDDHEHALKTGVVGKVAPGEILVPFSALAVHDRYAMPDLHGRPRRTPRPENPPRSAAAGGPPCPHRPVPPRCPPDSGSAGAGGGTAGQCGRRPRANRDRGARSARGTPAGGRRRPGAGGAGRASAGRRRRRNRKAFLASGRTRRSPSRRRAHTRDR